MKKTKQPTRRLKKGWEVFLNAFVIVFVALCVCLTAGAVLSRSGRSFFGFRSFIVLTGSMRPTFDAGSFIIVQDIRPEDMHVGDIITYQVEGDTMLTHRVVKIEKDDKGGSVFITQGDANNAADINPVNPRQVVGKAVVWINGLGQLLIMMQRPVYFISFLAIVAAALLMPEVFSWLRRKREDNEQQMKAI